VSRAKSVDLVRSGRLKPQGRPRVVQQTPPGVMPVAGQEIAMRAVYACREQALL
jgi:hypothetical protein